MKRNEINAAQKICDILGRIYLGQEYHYLIKEIPEIEELINKYGKKRLFAKKLYEHFRYQKVIENIAENMKQIGYENNVLTEIINRVRRDTKANVLKRKIASDISDKVMYIKGSAWLMLYDTCNQIRYQSDVDLLCKDEKDFWQVLDSIKEDYSYERLKKYNIGKHEICMSLDCKAKNNLDCDVDFHVGHYYVWGGIAVDIPTWDNARIIEGRIYPSYEDMFLMVLLHVATEWYYRLKDINDIWMLLSLKGKELNWKYVYEKIVQYKLENIYAILMLKVCEIYENVPECNISNVSLNRIQKRFMIENYGKQDYVAAIGLEASFTFKNYCVSMPPVRAFREMLKNTWCLVIAEYRAFPIKRLFRYKKDSFNSITVFKLKRKVKSKWRIYTPLGVWENSTYY